MEREKNKCKKCISSYSHKKTPDTKEKQHEKQTFIQSENVMRNAKAGCDPRDRQSLSLERGEEFQTPEKNDFASKYSQGSSSVNTSPGVPVFKVDKKVSELTGTTDQKEKGPEKLQSVHNENIASPSRSTPEDLETKRTLHCDVEENSAARYLTTKRVDRAATTEVDDRIQGKPLILRSKNPRMEGKSTYQYQTPRSDCIKEKNLNKSERIGDSLLVSVVTDPRVVSSTKAEAIQGKKTVRRNISVDFRKKEIEKYELKELDGDKKIAMKKILKKDDSLVIDQREAQKKDLKPVGPHEKTSRNRREKVSSPVQLLSKDVVNICKDSRLSSTKGDKNDNVGTHDDKVVGLEEKEVGSPHVLLSKNTVKLCSTKIARVSDLSKSSSQQNSASKLCDAAVISPIVGSSEGNSRQAIPSVETYKIPILDLKDTVINQLQHEQVDLAPGIEYKPKLCCIGAVIKKDVTCERGGIAKPESKSSSGLIKNIQLEKKDTDIFLSSRSQDEVLTEFSPDLPECQVLPIGCGQVDNKISSLNQNKMLLSNLLLNYLSPPEDAVVPRNANVALLSHKDTTSKPTNKECYQQTRQPLSDSKYNAYPSIPYDTSDPSYAPLTASVPQYSSPALSGIKSSTATMIGPPPGFLSPITVQTIDRGAQSVGSVASLSTSRSIGGCSIESGRHGRQKYQSKKRGHDVTSFTDLNDAGRRGRSDARTGLFLKRGKETNRGYHHLDQNQIDRNWHSDRSISNTSNPPSLGPASSYSASSADSFGGSRQGYSFTKQGWNQYGSNDRERSEANSLGSAASFQDTRTAASADYSNNEYLHNSSSSFAFSEGRSYSGNSSLLSNRSTEFAYDTTNYAIEKDSIHSYGVRDSTSLQTMLPPDRQMSQPDRYSKIANDSIGTSSISSVYPNISRSEVDSYSSLPKLKCGNSFALPPPKREKERDHKPILDHATSSEYTTSDQSWDYDGEEEDIMDDGESGVSRITNKSKAPLKTRKREWMLRMSRKVRDVPVGELDANDFPINSVMNAWAKTKSSEGATMVDMWLNRVEAEVKAGNSRPGIQPTTKMYTMAVDAWAKSGEGGKAAQNAETILQRMNQLYQSDPKRHVHLKPTTEIFNAVLNSWARSKETIAPVRAEEILNWMDTLYRKGNLDVKPDKYSYNTVIHAHAKRGSMESAAKAQRILDNMYQMYRAGNHSAKPDTVTYNICINAWAKSGGKGAAIEAENLLSKMHILHEMGEKNVKPSVVTYGAVIDTYAKCMEPGAASRGDTILADMIQRYQSNPSENTDLMPNTHVFNTVINCWSKSKDKDAAYKAEEMLVAMGRLQETGIPDLKPDAFTYTAVIDAWAKSGNRGSASRAEELLNRMESKYLAGDLSLKPNTFTYNAVINSLAKSGESGAAERAERVLQNMVNRHRTGGANDVKPTTINFNAVLDAWAKSGGGRAAAERAEKILEWMDSLHKVGNASIKPDTITFNACIDTWARSGDQRAPGRAEQILRHMDQLHAAGNPGIKPDSYTYNTVINAWAKSGERGAANKAETLLSIMEQKYRDGDRSLQPNTRTYTSTIDAWAKSSEPYAAKKAEQIFIAMQSMYESTRDATAKPNAHTANAVMNACAFTKVEDDKPDALSIAFRVFEWILAHKDVHPDAYTFTIMLSVCSNLLPRQDRSARFSHARTLFLKCREAGYCNDYVLRKLRQTVTEEEFISLVGVNPSVSNLPSSWTRNVREHKPWSKKQHRRTSNNSRRKGY